MNWKNMTFGKKVGVGFSALILITVILGGLGAWWMKSAQKDSEMLAMEYVPEMVIGAEIRGAANRLMYQMRGYGFTEDEQYYENAQKEANALTAGIKKGNDLQKKAVHLKALGGQLKNIETAEKQYRQAIEETHAISGKLAVQRTKLDENAAKYMQNSNDFLIAQNAAFKKDLSERQKKVEVVTAIVGLGTKVRVANFRAQATNDMELMQQAVEMLAGVKKHTDELRPVTRAEVNIKQMDNIEAATEKYAENMAAYIATTKTMEDAGKDMNASAARYMKNTNDFLASQNEAMEKEFGREGANLKERLQKITLVNDVIDAGNAARVGNFRAQALQDPNLIQETVEKFNGMKKITANLRKITRAGFNIKQIDNIESAADTYSMAMEVYLKNFRTLDTIRKGMDASSGQYVRNCETFLESQQQQLAKDMFERNEKISTINDIIDLGNDTRINAFKSQAMRDPSIMEQGQANFVKIDKRFVDIRKITRLAADLERLDNIQKAGAGYNESMGHFLTEWRKMQELGNTRNDLGNKMIEGTRVLQDAAAGATDRISSESAASLSTASTTMIAGLIAAFVIGTLLAFFIARGIINVLKRISSTMDEGAEQVASASGQVSSSSQSLAEGASEQASSIEETSSSLEEMSSMTKQNADNANQADGLMKEANQVVGQANDSMSNLTTSMEEISKASEETQKIIKTIDEIAFQTNLLALNAAVEAARAGEAGAGFAVVAEEVRNLAMRSADAAKGTAELIEGTVGKVSAGSELVNDTGKAFGQVAESSSKVGELVGEIAAASNEQAQGIEQVNKAITEMDKVVQQNAANAEESASASEEMNAQAEQMKASVGELMKMVGGSGKRNVRTATRSTKSDSTRHAFAAPAKMAKGREVAVQQAKEANPDQVIPMDDDFKDF